MPITIVQRSCRLGLANTKHLNNTCTTSAKRLRHCSNIVQNVMQMFCVCCEGGGVEILKMGCTSWYITSYMAIILIHQIHYPSTSFCRRIHEFDLILYLANKAIHDKNGVLDILNHMVRPRTTCSQARDYFYQINSFFKPV